MKMYYPQPKNKPKIVYPRLRIGWGVDIHPLVKGKPLFLGGIRFPGRIGLEGFSDGDVLLHALGDALLGALAKGDLGKHFPPGDIRYRDIRSKYLISQIYQMVSRGNWLIENIDLTVVAEFPRLSSRSEKIRRNIGQLLHIDVSRVSLKATTTERLGFLGRQEGIAAFAAVLLVKESQK